MGKVNLPAAWIKVIDQAWPAMVLLALVKSSIYADDKWQSVHSISNSVKSPANTSIHNRLSSIKYDDFLNSYSESAKWCVNLMTSWDINDGIFCVEHLNANPVVNSTSFVCLCVWVITCYLQNQGLYPAEPGFISRGWIMSRPPCPNWNLCAIMMIWSTGRIQIKVLFLNHTFDWVLVFPPRWEFVIFRFWDSFLISSVSKSWFQGKPILYQTNVLNLQ